MDLLAELKRRPLVCDGGMGTQLMAAGMPAGTNSILWNVDRPDAVGAVHRKYREAGCDLLTTNTFQGGKLALATHGLDGRLAELNAAGARVAKDAAGDGALVLADVGPCGDFLEPVGDLKEDDLAEMVVLQLSALRDAGADAVIIETMSDPHEVAVTIAAAKRVASWPVIACYAFQRSDHGSVTMMGTTVERALQEAIDAGADVVGGNCGTGLELDHYLALAGELVSVADEVPVILQPNAGSPRETADGLRWPADPDDMAALAPRLLDEGVRILGGCCGTTPAHLAAIAQAIRGRR